ncbi:MAG TPA: hypothetical protein VNH83_11450 [Bryobacteraceae bacterium]|nr:hypothetical protein [Bryobacteraceae bacterium]
MTIEEFKVKRDQGTVVGPEPAAQTVDVAAVPESRTASPEVASEAIAQAAVVDLPSKPDESRPGLLSQESESAIQRAPKTATNPAIFKPVELVSEQPPQSPATDPLVTAPDGGAIENPAIRQDTEILPETPEPAIELVSERPPLAPGADQPEMGIV